MKMNSINCKKNWIKFNEIISDNPWVWSASRHYETVRFNCQKSLYCMKSIIMPFFARKNIVEMPILWSAKILVHKCIRHWQQQKRLYEIIISIKCPDSLLFFCANPFILTYSLKFLTFSLIFCFLSMMF